MKENKSKRKTIILLGISIFIFFILSPMILTINLVLLAPDVGKHGDLLKYVEAVINFENIDSTKKELEKSGIPTSVDADKVTQTQKKLEECKIIAQERIAYTNKKLSQHGIVVDETSKNNLVNSLGEYDLEALKSTINVYSTTSIIALSKYMDTRSEFTTEPDYTRQLAFLISSLQDDIINNGGNKNNIIYFDDLGKKFDCIIQIFYLVELSCLIFFMLMYYYYKLCDIINARNVKDFLLSHKEDCFFICTLSIIIISNISVACSNCATLVKYQDFIRHAYGGNQTGIIASFCNIFISAYQYTFKTVFIDLSLIFILLLGFSEVILARLTDEKNTEIAVKDKENMRAEMNQSFETMCEAISSREEKNFNKLTEKIKQDEKNITLLIKKIERLEKQQVLFKNKDSNPKHARPRRWDRY